MDENSRVTRFQVNKIFLTNFNSRKLYGRIEEDLIGDYTITINNNYNVADFDGNKSIILSTSGPLGGRNVFLAVAFIIVGIICFVICAVFQIKKVNFLKYKTSILEID